MAGKTIKQILMVGLGLNAFWASSQPISGFEINPQPANDKFMSNERVVLDIDGSIHHANTYTRVGEIVKSHISFENHVDLELSTNASEHQLKNASVELVGSLGSELQIESPGDELSFVNSHKSWRYTHVSFDQAYKGIPVYGAQLKMHFDERMKLAHINGSTIQTPKSISTVPDISAESIIELLTEELGVDVENGFETTVGYHAPKAELVIYKHYGMSMLCWKINLFQDMLHNWEVIVSATSGKVLLRFNDVSNATPTEVKLNLSGRFFEDYGYQSIQTILHNGRYKLYDASLTGFELYNEENLAQNGGGTLIWNIHKTDKDHQGQRSQFNIPATQENSDDDLRSSWMSNWGSSSVFDAAATCQNHIRRIFEFYESIGFLGLDGKNATPIWVYMNAGLTNDTDDLIGFDGALWNNSTNMMVFGSGEKYFYQTAASLDLVAHEYTHGIIAHTSKLLGTGESRVINEAIADIMALVIAGKTGKNGKYDWQFGSDIIRESVSGQPYRGDDLAWAYHNKNIRDIRDPHNGFSSDEIGFHYKHVRDIRSNFESDWEVYHLSTLISHAFYNLIWNSKTNNGDIIEDGLDAKQWAEVFFSAARHHLTPNATFDDFIIAVKNAAIERFQFNKDGGKDEWLYAMEAFASVGFDIPEANPLLSVVLPPVEGESYILTKRTTRENLGVSAYSSDYLEDQRLLQSISLPKSEISTTDNGKMGFFIDQGGNVRKLDFELAHQNHAETVTLDSIFTIHGQETDWKWKSVSVSPMGDRLALIRKQQDASVYIYSVSKKELYQFEIRPFYHFNDSEGSDVYPVMAENISWSFNGTEILFDCASSRAGQLDEVNYHWNIAKIKVWDDNANQVTPGYVEVPMGGKQLPYVHYMNPRFAKNRPSLIVFDQYDDKAKKNSIWAYDLAQNTVIAPQKLFETPIAGHPCFTHNDNKIAYTTLNANGDTVIKAMDVSLDELEMLDTRHDIIGIQRKLPIWITLGERPMPNSESETLTNRSPKDQTSLFLYPNPTSDHLVITSTEGIQSLSIHDINGRIVLQKNLASSPLTNLTLNVAHLSRGYYTCIIVNDKGVLKKRLVKE